jgi:hypothetical protein
MKGVVVNVNMDEHKSGTMKREGIDSMYSVIMLRSVSLPVADRAQEPHMRPSTEPTNVGLIYGDTLCTQILLCLVDFL